MVDQLYSGISQETISRINQINKMDEIDLKKIKKGILSIHAKWSGQSITNGKSMLKLIDKSRLKNFEIYIIDIDYISPEKQIELLGVGCHGYFESFWIENGEMEFDNRNKYGAIQWNKFLELLNEKINK